MVAIGDMRRRRAMSMTAPPPNATSAKLTTLKAICTGAVTRSRTFAM